MDRRERTRKITYSAVCTALAVVVTLIALFTPVNIVPLIGASFAVYVAFMRCGIGYGVITALVTAFLCFIIAGLNVTFIFLVIVFLPYALVVFLMRKLSYHVTWQAAVRIACSTLFFVITCTIIIGFTDFLTGTDIMAIADRVGKPVVIALIALITLPVDLFFTAFAQRVMRTLK